MSYQQVVITKYGGPEVLEVITVDGLPVPQSGEVRIRTLATSASFTDTLIRRGQYFGVQQKPPFAPGYDVVGVVDALGAGVTGLIPGQRVAALTITGAYSEYVCLPAADCSPVPDDVDPAEAVSLVLTYVTAYQMLHRFAKVEPAGRILIHGASGAVGTALLQLGKLQNLEMVGTAARDHLALVACLGATPIDYRAEDFVERIGQLHPAGVDAVFDGIGGKNFKRSFSCLRQGGRLIAYGSYATAPDGRSNSIGSYSALMLRAWLTPGKSAAIYSITGLKKKHPEWYRADLLELLRLLKLGNIKPVIAHQLPLTEAADAHRMLEARHFAGKIVLVSG